MAGSNGKLGIVGRGRRLVAGIRGRLQNRPEALRRCGDLARSVGLPGPQGNLLTNGLNGIKEALTGPPDSALVRNIQETRNRNRAFDEAARDLEVRGITGPESSMGGAFVDGLIAAFGRLAEHPVVYNFPTAPEAVARALSSDLILRGGAGEQGEINRVAEELRISREEAIKRIGNQMWRIANKFDPNVLYGFIPGLDALRDRRSPMADFWGDLLNVRRIDVRFHVDGFPKLAEIAGRYDNVNLIYPGTHRSHGDYLYDSVLFHLLDVIKRSGTPPSALEPALHELMKGMSRSGVTVNDLRTIMPEGRHFLPLIVAGINLKGITPFVKMTAFFVHRTFKDLPLERAAYNAYVRMVGEYGHQMIIYPEGGRSYDNRLGRMNVGSLVAAVEGLSLRRARGENVETVMVPVKNNWVDLAGIEMDSMMQAALGGRKGVENQLAAISAAARVFTSETGRVHISMLEPIAIGEFLTTQGVKVEDFHQLPNNRKYQLMNELGNALRRVFANHSLRYDSRVRKTRLLAAAIMYPSGHAKSVELTEAELAKRVEMVHQILALNEDANVRPPTTPVRSMVGKAEEITHGILKRAEDGRLIVLDRTDRPKAAYFAQPLVEATSPYSIAAIAMLMALEGVGAGRVRRKKIRSKFIELTRIFNIPFPSYFKGSKDDIEQFNQALDRLEQVGWIESSKGGSRGGKMFRIKDKKMMYAAAWVLRFYIEAYKDTANILGHIASSRNTRISEEELANLTNEDIIERLQTDYPDLTSDAVGKMSAQDFLKQVPFYTQSHKLTAKIFRKQEAGYGTEQDRTRVRLEILLRDVESRSPWYEENDVITKVLDEARAKNKWRSEEMINALVALGIMERKLIMKNINGKDRAVPIIRFSSVGWKQKRTLMIKILKSLAAAERMISLGVGLFDGIPEVGSLPTDFAEDGTP